MEYEDCKRLAQALYNEAGYTYGDVFVENLAYALEKFFYGMPVETLDQIKHRTKQFQKVPTEEDLQTWICMGKEH